MGEGDATSHAQQQAHQQPASKREERRLRAEKLFLTTCLFAAVLLALLASATTTSSLMLTVIGFLPLIVTIVCLIVLSDAGFKQGLYWATPFAICILFLGIFGIVNPAINYQLNVGSLTVVNLVLGLLVTVVLVVLEGRELLPTANEPEEFKPEKLDEYVHSIEDKCKALNFVVGRVYRASNGGTSAMREKLRIGSELYNEFESIKPGDLKEKKDEAHKLLKKIHDKLLLYAKKENEVFSEAELKALKTVMRNLSGNDAVIDVLMTNDRDPVQYYYAGAVQTTRRLLSEIEKL